MESRVAGHGNTGDGVSAEAAGLWPRRAADVMLRGYQRWVSPVVHGVAGFLGITSAGCRFLPTCSEYAREAVAKYGVKRGGWMAARRVLRCHPWSKKGRVGGWDPVE